MHSSFFEYNISRPYPFKWFTPAVVIGGAVAVVLLSILNLGSSGYTQTVQYSHDPNATVSDEASSKYWRSFPTTKPQATCQSVNIPINTRLLTNNTALTSKGRVSVPKVGSTIRADLATYDLSKREVCGSVRGPFSVQMRRHVTCRGS